MTETAAVAKKEQKPVNILVIELVGQTASNYFLDNGVGQQMEGIMPQAISYPSARMIKSRSVITKWNDAEKVFEHIPIRYIKGCNEILVSKQDAALIKPVPQEDVIWIINGRLIVNEIGGDIGKYRYLKAYEGNVDAPNRPEGAPDVYREISTEVAAVDTEKNYDAEFEVLKYLNSLKVKSNGHETTYNEDTIEFLCHLFKITTPFDSGYKSEAWVALAEKAKASPEMFLKRIMAERAVIEAEVHQAKHVGALTFDLEKAILGRDTLVTHFDERMSEDERIDKVIDLFSNPKNNVLHNELKIQLKMKQQAVSGKIS
jgi:hypothetical protein